MKSTLEWRTYLCILYNSLYFHIPPKFWGGYLATHKFQSCDRKCYNSTLNKIASLTFVHIQDNQWVDLRMLEVKQDSRCKMENPLCLFIKRTSSVGSFQLIPFSSKISSGSKKASLYINLWDLNVRSAQSQNINYFWLPVQN